jgi:GT2 family glycosyltransferase
LLSIERIKFRMKRRLSLTVAVCTHERFEQLSSCLISLAQEQSLLRTSRVKFLVLDNSYTNLTQLGLRDLPEWKNLSGKKYFRLSSIGLSDARNFALSKSKTDFVLYLDDDATICENYLQNWLDFIDDFPNVAMAGGPIIPVWEGQKPKWLTKHIEMALPSVMWEGDFPRPLAANEWVAGANFLVNRRLALSVKGFNNSLGRKGHLLLSNEEIDIAYKIKDLGCEIFWNPSSSVLHPVTKNRLTKDYSIRRFVWQSVSNVFMNRSTEVKTFEDFFVNYGLDLGQVQLLKNTIKTFEKDNGIDKTIKMIQGLTEWMLVSGKIFDETELETTLESVTYKKKSNAVFLDYVGHKSIMDYLSINDNIDCEILPNLWVDTDQRHAFKTKLISLGEKYNTVIIGNLDMLLDVYGTGITAKLIESLAKECQVKCVIHRGIYFNETSTISKLVPTKNVEFIVYSRNLRDYYKNLMNLALWPLPPDYRLIPIEQQSSAKAPGGILNIGIFGDARTEKNVQGQINLCNRINKLMNGEIYLAMKIFGADQDTSQIINKLKSNAPNKEFGFDYEVRNTRYSDKEIREVINKSDAFLWSPLSISYAECASLYLYTIILSGKVILTNDIGIKASNSFDKDYSQHFINIEGLDSRAFLKELEKFYEYKNTLFKQRDLINCISLFYRNLFVV